MIFRSKLPPVASCVPKDKPPPTKRTGFLLLLALILSVAGAGAGCKPAPQKPVESYDKIKEVLADQPSILYPDLSKYEQTGTLVYELHLQVNMRDSDGYAVRSLDNELEKYTEVSVFKSFGVACMNPEGDGKHYYDESGYDPNMHYRGVEMKYSEADITEAANGEDSSHPYPDGSRIGSLSSTFKLDGCRYWFSADILLTPDDLEVTTYEEEMAKAYDELFVLVDSLLDQGGIPK
ncbi:MAG: hypothetical protein LBU48_02365 [Coriobacteriales bacterium]|jgi:hypothetical protein|nr:hypothetical protein [Coriobacteriales bacterium]